jgi:predicted Ser/Thr protein kinase
VASTIPEQIGRYKILERVGKGGMGVLYRGIDPVLDREVAIKVMLVDFSDDTEQMRPRFYREAQAAAKLQHSNIVTIFEFAEDNNTPYIVMEFLRGTPLDERLKSPIPLTLEEKVHVVAQLCTALNYAHEQGVVHRDIKPANLFLLPDGTVKLLDFGVAKLTTSTLTRQGDVLGSVSYMSPEQVSGSDSLDGRSDIFSVGVMLYELLMGRKPFQGDSPTSTIVKILREDPPGMETLASTLPPRLISVMRKALAKDPTQRFATAGDMSRELQAVRRNLQPAVSETDGLDETRFASPVEMQEIQKQLDADAAAAAAAASASRRAGRWWAVPAGVAAAALVGVAALTLANRETGEAANAASTPAAATGSTPSAAPSAPAGRTIRVESVPAGASITLDGRATNEITPAPLTVAGEGPFTLRLTKRGYVTQDVKLTAEDLQRGSVSYTLPAAEVQRVAVSINSAYPVVVMNGSQEVGAAATSHSLNIATNTRLRVVSREFMLDAPVSVGTRAVQYTAPGVGYLTVLTNRYETCNVKIGDRPLGFPPITRKAIVAGEYRVDLVCQGGGNPPGQFVSITPNQTATLKVQ